MRVLTHNCLFLCSKMCRTQKYCPFGNIPNQGGGRYPSFSLTWWGAVFFKLKQKHICIKIQVNSGRVNLGHQHGCCLFVLWHQHGCGDIRWKPPIQKLCEGKRKRVKYFTCITNLLQTCLDDPKRHHESTSGEEVEEVSATRKKKPRRKPVLSESETDSERERGADALTKEKSRHKEAADEGKSSRSKESFVLWTFFHS